MLQTEGGGFKKSFPLGRGAAVCMGRAVWPCKLQGGVAQLTVYSTYSIYNSDTSLHRPSSWVVEFEYSQEKSGPKQLLTFSFGCFRVLLQNTAMV